MRLHKLTGRQPQHFLPVKLSVGVVNIHRICIREPKLRLGKKPLDLAVVLALVDRIHYKIQPLVESHTRILRILLLLLYGADKLSQVQVIQLLLRIFPHHLSSPPSETSETRWL